MNNIYDVGDIIRDYSDVEKIDINAIIDVPIIVHDVTVMQSRYHDNGSQRCAVLIFSPVAKPDYIRKIMIWRAYMIYSIDKVAGYLLRTSEIGGYYHCAVPFSCRITMVGKFYRIASAKRMEEGGNDGQEV